MATRGILSELFCLLLTALSIFAQSNSPGAKGLSDSIRRVAFENDAFFGDGEAMPRWDNGYLVSRRVETFEPGVSNVLLYDQSGKRAREAAVWFPGSQRVLLYSVATTSNGQIIAGGSANKADGSVVPFISLTDVDGKIVSAIQTSGFVPKTICWAPDGTVWSFGGTGFDASSQPNPGDTLRHFDLQKGQIASYLPRSSFSNKHPEVLADIRCSAQEMIVYIPSVNGYVEMKYGDAAPHLYHATAPSDLKLRGFATTGTKQVYGFFSRPNFGGLYYLSFDEAGKTVTWLPVKGTVGSRSDQGVIIGLWGSDADKLLVSRSSDAVGAAAVHWTVVVN